MNLQNQATVLRTQLLDMSRLSQRALDYSIKGYQLSSPEFSTHAGSVRLQLQQRYYCIRELSHELGATGASASSDFRFSLAALRLNRAFYKTYRAAARIAQTTRLRLESCSIEKCAALNKFAEFVNSLVRLSTVALFLNDASYAEAVLRSHAALETSSSLSDHSQNKLDDPYTAAITQNLRVISSQSREMANAILFWLEEKDRALPFETEGRHTLEHLIPENRLAAKNRIYPACNQVAC